MKVNLKIRKTTKREKVEFIIGLLLLLFVIWYFTR
nr:MAG TPA: Type II secretion system, protein M [Caudoviricetes sp.]DAY21368.1 MAG TPA: Type II secretion system, protein M [Caudoviricetes sp.]